jgi:hypothetical protein
MNIDHYPDKTKKRILTTASGRDCDYIPKVENAGEVIDNYQLMFNGIKVLKDCYYGAWATDLIQMCRGHHEPQEEKAFYEVLKYINNDSPVMVEVGSYWAYYSMWFNRSLSNARNYMIEPKKANLDIGEKNFRLNDIEGGTFIHKGVPEFKLDWLMNTYGIDSISIVHADIQGREGRFLNDNAEVIDSGKVDYLFISTHLLANHSECLKFFNNHNIEILCEHNKHQSFSVDGLIVGKCKHVENDLHSIQISKR